jgi:RNA polymerase sigma-70 factor (ECF subfamily)
MRDPGPGVKSPAPESEVPRAGAEDVALAVGGDPVAFERLYRANVARVHGLAVRLIGYDEAAEVTQDVFVRAWQKLAGFRGEAAFSTWLHRLAVNLMLGRRAWLGMRRARFLPDGEALESAPARPAATDLALDFESAIAKLPSGARAVLVLHDVEGYRHEEIAGLMKVTTGTTKAQLHRARMLMRGHLGA